MANIKATTPVQVQAFLEKQGIAVVDCYTDWCKPCIQNAPVYPF